MCAPGGPVLGQGRRQHRVQLRARVIREELVGHVALRFGGGVVGRQIHAARDGVGDGLVRLGPRVEIEEGGDDVVVDLAAVVVGGQHRGDGRAHGAVRRVIRELAGHEARHLALVPVGHQLAGDERQHLGLGPVLGQVERVEGRRDGSSVIGFDEDRVVEVLEGGGERPGHGQIPEGAPEQVERRPAGPGLAVAQGDGDQRRRDGRLNLGDGPKERQIDGGEPRRYGSVGLRRGVVGRERRGNRGVPLDDGPVAHQGVRDGLIHRGGVAVVQELGVRVVLGLRDAGHEVEGDLGLREIVGQARLMASFVSRLMCSSRPGSPGPRTRWPGAAGRPPPPSSRRRRRRWRAGCSGQQPVAIRGVGRRAPHRVREQGAPRLLH